MMLALALLDWLPEFLRMPLAFAFVLGVLVFVHELGHFLAAKRVGIRVLKFQLGFNPTIVSFRRGDTEYGIGALPLGGYVKMAGETPEDIEQERGFDVGVGSVGGRPADEFMSKTKWQRFQVLIMGPVMNILLAFVLTALVLYQGGVRVPAYDDQPPVVGAMDPGSPAERAGIQPGDRIVAIGDHRVDTWEQFYIMVGSRAPNREVAIQVARGGDTRTLRVTPIVPPGQNRFEIADIGVKPNVHPHLETVTPEQPADKAGLKRGDVVLAFDGRPMITAKDLRDEIARHADQTVTLSIARGEESKSIAVPLGHNGTSGWLGVLPVDDFKSIKPNFVQALSMSVSQNVEYAGLIGQTVWGLVTRETSPKQLMGPVGIMQMSGEAARFGLMSLLSFMAMISLNLGLVNLLPIPILDGGHIFIMALEGVARRDFSMRVKEKMLLAGFVLILMLMVTVIYNDLTRISWIERFMPWR